VREAEGQVTGRFSARRIDEAEGCAVKQQADGSTCLTKQPLEASVRRGTPAGVICRRAVEVDVESDDGDEREPSVAAAVLAVAWAGLKPRPWSFYICSGRRAAGERTVGQGDVEFFE